MSTRSALCAALVALGLISSARGGVLNLLSNGGLEKNSSTVIPHQGFVTASPVTNSTALPGWTVVSGSVDVVPSAYWQAAQGSYSVDMIGTPGLGVIQQTVATTIGTTYILTFDLAANPTPGRGPSEKADTKRLQVQAIASNLVGSGSVNTPALAGAPSPILNTQTYSITAGTRNTAGMQYLSESFTFMATSDSTIINLAALAPLNMPRGITSNQLYTGPVVDNLVLQVSSGTEPAPEPASLGILGAGASALLLRRRRGR